MKVRDLTTATTNEARLVRAAAFTVIGAIVIVALYFGRDVLIPAAVAILFSFVLGPLVTALRRILPLTVSVAMVVLGALIVAALLAVLFMTQLAEVADGLTGYQANLQHKIQDIRSLTEGGGAVSRFVSMLASLGQELAPSVGPSEPAVRVQASGSSFASVATFVAPLLHPVLTIGIVVVLVVFILLDREHLGDQFVRLFGASDVHATSEAIGDAARRVARVLSLQLMTNVGFAVLVGLGLFALGLPNAALWGLLAGGLRFVPYVGPILGAVLPTLIAFAVMPGWAQPFLVLGWIIVCDLVVGQIVEPLLFGESTGVTPLALIMSAIFWGTLWGPVGLLLSTPLTICLLVLGRHVPHLGFLQVLLGAEPALVPYQQIYHRLIRKAVADASSVALAEIEEKGRERGLDDGMGRMIVLAEADRAHDRLSAEQVEAIVHGTDEILDFLAADSLPIKPAKSGGGGSPEILFRCVGGRAQIDDAAAAIIAFAMRQAGFEVECHHRGDRPSENSGSGSRALDLICYASRPSDAVRRYTTRKLTSDGMAAARHLIIDYSDSAPAGAAGAGDAFAGDIATLCRLASEHAVAITRDQEAVS